MGVLWVIFVVSPLAAWFVWIDAFPREPGSLPVSWWALVVLWAVTLTGASPGTWWASLGMFAAPWTLARTTRLRPGESPMKLLEISPFMTPTLKYATGAVGLAACVVRWL